MNVALFTRKATKSTIPFIIELLDHFKLMGWNPVVESELKKDLVKKIGLNPSTLEFNSFLDFKQGIDMMVSLGGDGTFIQCVNYIRDSEVPIIGINTGRLGFLANIPTNAITEALDKLQRKEFSYEQRSLLQVETESHHFGDRNFALNEVTVSRKDSSAMLTVHAQLDDRYMNSYWADGLIISTPTGSTAYNLACGGPIIDPQCQLHVVTPIAPHNLNVRPFVVPDSSVIKLSVEGRSRNYLLSLDGQSVNIKQREEVEIRKADFNLNVIKLDGHYFVDTIRNKMLWGIDRRNA